MGLELSSIDATSAVSTGGVVCTLYIGNNDNTVERDKVVIVHTTVHFFCFPDAGSSMGLVLGLELGLN